MEVACAEQGNAAEVNHAAAAPDDDALSVGPDITDLPVDAPPEAGTPTQQDTPPAEREEEEAVQMEQGTEEEEHTGRDEPPTSQPEEQLEGADLPEQPEGGEEEERGESVPQIEEEEVVVGEKEAEDKAQLESEHPAAAQMTEDTAAGKENPPPQEATEAGEPSGAPCSCQALFSNCSSHPPSRRKTRPCSLPVSELETVIASACGEPETPRSHYIRIHHLLHSLPSARAPSQEKDPEEEGSSVTSPTLKPSKEEEWEQKEEDTTQSPSQVGPLI